VVDRRAGFSIEVGLRRSTFFCPVLDTFEEKDRTDAPDELRLSMAGGVNFEASVAVRGRLAVAKDKVDVPEAADGRRGRLIFGVEGLTDLTLDTVDAVDVLREAVLG